MIILTIYSTKQQRAKSIEVIGASAIKYKLIGIGADAELATLV